MNCPKCNKVIQDNAIFCGYCGEKVDKQIKPLFSRIVLPASTQPSQTPVQSVANVAKCPICGSTSLQAKNKGVSVGKSVAGALLIGPLGLAAGAVGMNDTKIVCLKCGYEFTPSK